MSYHRTQ